MQWLDRLRPFCSDQVVLFYLARWCQKETRKSVPDLDSLDEADLRAVADKIAGNLAEDGERVERLVAGDAGALVELWRELLASSAPVAGARAADFADEGHQKVIEVLLVGTRPSHAVEELRNGPEGPANEYVFTSPFSFWARRVVKNLVVDEQRAATRDRKGPSPPARRKARTLSRALLKQAHDALPGLLEAIRELPPAQRATMTASLMRCEVDELARERLHVLAPDLFADFGSRCFSSDLEIAEYLDSTPRRVASNRHEARRRLVEGEPPRKLLLDSLLPHRSTRRAEAVAGATSESAT